MNEELRYLQETELEQRYGKDYFTFPNDCGCRMVKVHYVKSELQKIDVIFSLRLPVDQSGQIIDPTIPDPSTVTEREQHGYKIVASSLTGTYLRHTNELHLTATSPCHLLRIHKISRLDGAEITSKHLVQQTTIEGGKIVFAVVKFSDDRKTAMVYVLAEKTGKLEDVTVKLEV